MLQKEVADRLVAPVGTRDYGVLTVLIGRRARVTHLLTLPPGAFRPPPEVTSAVVRLEFLPEHEVIRAPSRFDEMVRALFTRRRKTMSNALAGVCRHVRRRRGATAVQHRHRPAAPPRDADDRGVRAGGSVVERGLRDQAAPHHRGWVRSTTAPQAQPPTCPPSARPPLPTAHGPRSTACEV